MSLQEDKKVVALELTDVESNFLVSLLKNVVPTLNVPAKDAVEILSTSEAILKKMQGE